MRSLKILAVLSFLMIGTAQAAFIGTFELVDNPGGKDGKLKKLKNDFAFKDKSGVGWEAAAGLETDGASIPFWAQPVIGQPYDGSYIKAAVLHDHYCDRKVRDWKKTHRMFYDALIEQGVPKIKAGVMYGAVMIGGPTWTEVNVGKKCKLTDVCIRTVGGDRARMVWNQRPAVYDQIGDLAERLRKIEQRLNAAGDFSAEDVEAIAVDLAPENSNIRQPAHAELEEISLPTK
ncbi:MAG TPA: DUF1353 domain-containing protein [Beijerinckiaceae bacterium]|nr:DUF1353 domain-containing protein [Beijerinckiaceae bacterium]